MRSFPRVCLSLLLVGLLAAGCASTKNNPTPTAVGTWHYTVAHTPQGEGHGTIVIVEEDDGDLDGEMSSDLLGQTVEIENVAFGNNSLSFDATFTIEGQPVTAKAQLQLEGDTMAGTIDLPGTGVFNVQAIREAETD